jgi:hypothetical protein
MRQRLERGGEAVLGQHRWMKTARECSELFDGRLQLLDGGCEQPLELRVGVVTQAASCRAQRERESKEPIPRLVCRASA